MCGEGVWSGREAVAQLPLVKGEGWAEGLGWLGSAQGARHLMFHRSWA